MLYDSIYDFFNNLWDFYNLLDDSWDNYDLFDDLLDLNNFGYFDHLFNDLINMHSDLFNSFDGSWNLNDFFYNNPDWIALSDVVVDWLFNFDYLVDLDDLIDVPINFNNPWNLDLLDNDLSYNFRYSNNSFLDEWYFNPLFNNFLYFLNQVNCVINNLFDLSNSVLIDNLLFDNSNFFNCRNFDVDLNDFLNNLRNFNNLFDRLNNWDRFFDYNFNDFGEFFNMVHYFSSRKMLDNSNDLFSDNFDFYDLGHGYDFFYNFFYDLFNLNNPLDDLFYGNNLFLNHLDLLNLRNGVIHNLFNN